MDTSGYFFLFAGEFRDANALRFFSRAFKGAVILPRLRAPLLQFFTITRLQDCRCRERELESFLLQYDKPGELASYQELGHPRSSLKALNLRISSLHFMTANEFHRVITSRSFT